jgi:hypothetical protein
MSPSPRNVISIGDAPASARPLTFGEAMAALCRGAKVRRIEWPNAEDYVYLGKDGLVWTHRDGKEHHLLLGDGDIVNNDWRVLKA